jgi:hypothetical protein
VAGRERTEARRSEQDEADGAAREGEHDGARQLQAEVPWRRPWLSTPGLDGDDVEVVQEAEHDGCREARSGRSRRTTSQLPKGHDCKPGPGGREEHGPLGDGRAVLFAENRGSRVGRSLRLERLVQASESLEHAGRVGHGGVEDDEDVARQSVAADSGGAGKRRQEVIERGARRTKPSRPVDPDSL